MNLKRLGVMQGRLSSPEGKKIQFFPVNTWRSEFYLLAKMGVDFIEWTIDNDGLYDNPIMLSEGRAEIEFISQQSQVSVKSVTCDCFMQAPFWKAETDTIARNLENDFINVMECASALGIGILVIPMVDEGSLKSQQEADNFYAFINKNRMLFSKANVKLAIESDLTPEKLRQFIERFPSFVGVNYDSGNSAALGYDPLEEFANYANRIFNIHIKDRVYQGQTVPLGRGNVDFEKLSDVLKKFRYRDFLILQAARETPGKEFNTITKYLNFLKRYFPDA